MLGTLDFVHLPSRDVEAALAHWTHAVGGEVVFAIERFDTRVAMVERSRADRGDSLPGRHDF